MKPLRQALGWAWQWSWVVTVPLLVASVHWALQTWHRFHDFGLRVDTTPYTFGLRDCGNLEFEHLLRQAQLMLNGARPGDAPETLRLRNVQLIVPEDRLAALDAELPYSGTGQYQRGSLLVDGKLREVDVRYRGDTVLHWGLFKKSFRVKTKKDDLFEGMRSFNLIAAKFPEQLNNFLSYRLAAMLGLIAPRVELVAVWLNGSYHGVYELTEQLDEGTLRSHDRMPGDIYSGELIVQDRVNGTTNRLFELPRLWTKVAANNHRDAASLLPLERLCRLLQQPPSEASHAELAQLLDLDQMAALSAFELLTQTHHDDEAHNWRLFWDPWRLRIEPIVWDPAGWHESMRPLDGKGIDHDAVYCQLHDRLHQDAGFLAARFACLQRFFANGDDRRFLELVDHSLLQAHLGLHADRNAMPQQHEAITTAMLAFRAFIARVLRELASDHLGAAEQLAFAATAQADTLVLQVTTRQALDGIELVFDRPVQPSAVTVVVPRTGGDLTADLLAGTEVQPGRLFVPLPLLSELHREFELRHASIGNRNQRRRVAPTACTLRLAGVDLAHLVEVRGRRAAGSVPFTRTTSIPLPPVDLLYGLLRAPQLPVTTLAGEIEVQGCRQVDGPVLIRAGTVFRLAPQASLLFTGRVLAEGTEAQPIRFVPARPPEPWGAVALVGTGCSGSRLRHCTFELGSGHKDDLAEYSGMFNVHLARDVEVADCWFHDNRVVDDMVHVIYAETRFLRCRLDHALSDMLDCDISKVTVTGCSFADSGNDGLDLMTTQALVDGCRFARNGDKGISIGEGSHLLVLRSRFQGCNKAMEAKDGSRAAAANVEVRDCTLALNAYRKNWRYDGGGELLVLHSRFVGNQQMPTADRWSQVAVVDCRTDRNALPERTPDGGRNHAQLQDCSDDDTPATPVAPPFPPELEALRPMAGAAWKSIDHNRRGVHPDGD